MDANGWTEIRKRVRKSVFERLGKQKGFASNHDQLEKVSLNIYIANFPSHLSTRELRLICGRVGTVVDVYVARNKNVQGQTYGFVRFVRVENQNNQVQSLCKIRIGNLMLHANVSTRPRHATKPPIFRPIKFQPAKPIDTHAHKNVVSYASMVSEKKEEKIDVKVQEAQSYSTSIECEVMSMNAYPCALIACFKDFRAIANTRSLCQGEGFGDVEPKYLGGLWVLLEFQSIDRRDAFLNHKAIMLWIDELKPWHNDFVVRERILWVEAEGIPLLAWSEDTFKRIASKWGELVFVDSSNVTNRFSARLGIKTGHAALVFQSVSITVLGVEYCLRIRELSSWTPHFIAGFNEEKGDAISDGEDEDSENCSVHSMDAFQYVNPPEHVEEKVKSQPVVENLNKVVEEVQKVEGERVDSDPFNLGDLIEKETKKHKPSGFVMTETEVGSGGHPLGVAKPSGFVTGEVELESVGYPPGFTPHVSVEQPTAKAYEVFGGAMSDDYIDKMPRTPVHLYVDGGEELRKAVAGGMAEGADRVDAGEVCGGGAKMPAQFYHHSISVIEKLDSAIAVGKALGWDMAGCELSLQSIIAEHGESTGFK